MAREIRAFANTIPAGTPIATPAVFDMGMPARIVDKIEIHVPPGPNGQMGFQVAAAGIQIIPANAGMFIIASDDLIEWPLTDQLTSGAWQMIGYNTGQYDHTVYFRFLLSLVQDVAPTPPPAPDLTALSSSPAQTDQATAAAQSSLDALIATLAQTPSS
jgi:hypothetical protein